MFAVQTSVTFLPGLLLEISNVSGREFTGMRTMKCMPIAFDANWIQKIVWEMYGTSLFKAGGTLRFRTAKSTREN